MCVCLYVYRSIFAIYIHTFSIEKALVGLMGLNRESAFGSKDGKLTSVGIETIRDGKDELPIALHCQ